MPSALRRRLVPRAIASVALLMLGACSSEIRFSDSVDLELDFREGSRGGLHSPYVEGAALRVHARDAASREPIDMAGYSLASSDPEVLIVDAGEADGASAWADARAAGRGRADLLLLDDDGDVVASAEIEVRTPTRAVLHAAAPLFLDRDDVPSTVADPTVLTGGLATFAIAYYDGATRLHGSGALTAGGSEGIDVGTVTTHLDETRDWLQVTPQVEGLHDVQLAAGGQPFAQVQIEAVAPEAIADVELRGQNESRAERDELLVVIAQAYDDDGDVVLGAAFDWELAGFPDGERGDLYRYAYQPERGKPLAASFGELRSEALIHADEGWVDSSNHVGCSLQGRASSLSMLGLLALFACRRRRPVSPAPHHHAGDTGGAAPSHGSRLPS